MHLKRESQLAFLALSSSPKLQFAAYGGWLLLDSSDRVLAVQSISLVPDDGEYELPFGAPRQWRHEFTPQLVDAGRFQPVTVKFLQSKGAEQFCWLCPGERLTVGPEAWVPSDTGAFVYLTKGGEVLSWFPTVLGNYRLTTVKAAVPE